MSNYDFLRKVPLFQDLPDPDLRQLCRTIQPVRLAAGEVLFAEGSPGDRAFVIKSGQVEILKESDGRQVLLNVCSKGDVIGEMALLESMPRTASVRARSDSELLAIHQEQFEHLLNTSPSATRAMFHTVLGRLRATASMLRHGEKMAQLGTLTAGVAHELDNPAAAVKRGADQMQSAITQFGEAQMQMGRLDWTPAQQQALGALADRARTLAARPPAIDSLTRSDREHELETWLNDRGVADAWELAPALVNVDLDAAGLDQVASGFSAGQLLAVVRWLNATYVVFSLLVEIGQGAGRISEIVRALKSYSYLDQAPVQSVDVHEGLDNTLVILRHKLKTGIQLRREYTPDLPKIEAFGSELNQVWTNIVDNAADALGGEGEIVIRTRREGDGVLVEVEDNGPGIPPEIQSRIFDPFFTTKPPGKGTGLGLDISYKIVVHKHRGDMRVESRPGRTVFQVWLPINFAAR